MTVKDLKKLLTHVDDDRLVILSKDGEGNSYSPLSSLDDECTWSGEIRLEHLTPELIEQGYTEEDLDQDEAGGPALVLFPVN